MRFIITPLAERDIEDIGDYIARDNPRRALGFITELRGQCARLAKTPQICLARGKLSGLDCSQRDAMQGANCAV